MNARIQRLVALASGIALLPLCAFADTARIEPGHSAIWGDPGRDSEGWIVEILPDDTAALYWYTFDDAGKPRWITSVAPIVHDEDGDRIVFDELLAGRGGRFGTNYPASSVILENVGIAELSFSSCDKGRISFNAYGKTRSIPLVRRTRTMGAGCAPIHGIPGEQIQPHAGTSGTWIDPAKAGQTFTLQWQADGSAKLYWFTFDANGKPFWVSGIGGYEDGRIVFPQMESVKGGRFGEHSLSMTSRLGARQVLRSEQIELPEPITKQPWGRVELELTCDNGTATYQSTAAGFGSGSFDLLPMSGLVKLACPWVKPKFSDLYDVEWTEVPNREVDVGGGTTMPVMEVQFARSIANDGTIVGKRGNSKVVRFSPGARDWEEVPSFGLLGTDLTPVRISPDAQRIYARGDIIAAGQILATSINVWTEDIGWVQLPNMLESQWQDVTGQSTDGRWLVGVGREFDSSESFAWKWSAATGQVKLPTSEAIPESWPVGIANDGSRIAGEFVNDPDDEFDPIAIEWINGQAPDWVLTPGQTGPFPTSKIFGCDADCSLLIGTGRASPAAVPPEGFTESWYRTPDGEFTYIEKPVVAIEQPGVQRLHADLNVAGGGATIAAGYYSVEEHGSLIKTDGWLWTQNTGTVDLGGMLMSEYGVSGGLDARYVDAISADGRSFLIWDGDPLGKRAILRLIPKATP